MRWPQARFWVTDVLKTKWRAQCHKWLRTWFLNLLGAKLSTVSTTAPTTNRETRHGPAPNVNPFIYSLILISVLFKWDNDIPVTPAAKTATREKSWDTKDECVNPLFDIFNSSTHCELGFISWMCQTQASFKHVFDQSVFLNYLVLLILSRNSGTVPLGSRPRDWHMEINCDLVILMRDIYLVSPSDTRLSQTRFCVSSVLFKALLVSRLAQRAEPASRPKAAPSSQVGS